jgi:CRISPR/Cas system CMR subunit Cmr4 (Cas7 group RAMP superfamily)
MNTNILTSISSPDSLDKMKKTIEGMSKYHQIEVLKILSKNLCKLNENKSGVYVNMSFLNEETLSEIRNYIQYTQEQENNIVTMEYQKEEFKNTFFTDKEDKENPILYYSSNK